MKTLSRILLALAIAAVSVPYGRCYAEDEKTPPPKAKEPAGAEKSLDDQLLDSLKDELLDDLEIPAEKPEAKPPQGEKPEPAIKQPRGDDGLDQQLREQAGEDVLLEKDDPLSSIAQQMRAVEELIAQLDPSEPTQDLQEKIVKDLDQLIKEMRKRQQQGGSSSNQQMASRRSKVDQPTSRPGQGGGDREANRPARDSTDRLGPDKVQEIDMAEMQTLLKDLWGHLPERAREQMLQSSVDQFLPKYEVMIEKYFRRLAEDSQEAPRK